MKVIDRVLARPEFQDAPPVLVDIGASGGLNPSWRHISRHSVCIAFDGNEEEIKKVSCRADSYKRLHVSNLLVTENGSGEAEFFITKSGQCSSVLSPSAKQLADWAFADRFEVTAKRTLKTTNLPTIMRQLGLQAVDWFKSDSQGTDLRLFRSLGSAILPRVLVAEFEPGIIDAYEGEDKLWQLMAFMDRCDFWMSDINIKGSQWLRKESTAVFSPPERNFVSQFLKRSPGWGEVSYLNRFHNPDFTIRDYLLGWVFAMMKRQFGFALQLATTGRERFDDPEFDELRESAIAAVRLSYFKPSPYIDLAQRAIARLRRVNFR